MQTEEQFRAELDQAGEDVVRERIATKRYSDVNHRRSLAQERLDRKQRLRDEAQREIARSTKDAAWAAADAARESAKAVKASNTRATFALILAAASLIATIILAYVQP